MEIGSLPTAALSLTKHLEIMAKVINFDNASLQKIVELADFSAYHFEMYAHIYTDIGEGFISAWFNNPDGTMAHANSRYLKTKNVEKFVANHQDFNIKVEYDTMYNDPSEYVYE